jgi:hypothetical protein
MHAKMIDERNMFLYVILGKLSLPLVAHAVYMHKHRWLGLSSSGSNQAGVDKREFAWKISQLPCSTSQMSHAVTRSRGYLSIATWKTGLSVSVQERQERYLQRNYCNGETRRCEKLYIRYISNIATRKNSAIRRYPRFLIECNWQLSINRR